MILAHDTPAHLSRLIEALRHPLHRFFVHVDRKAELRSFLHVEADDVALLDARVPVYWGDFSQVEASLELLRGAVGASDEFDYFVLMSGSDYPLYGAQQISAFFSTARDLEFISTVRLPCEAAGKPLDRMTAYKPAGDPASIRYRLTALAVRLGRYSRDFRAALGSLVPLAGSSWWALTRSAAETVLRFIDAEPAKVAYFRNSYCPDESFFQTIIGNSPRKQHIRRALFYADWSAGGPSPALISPRHLPLFEDHLYADPTDPYGPGLFLFARKFADDAEDLTRRIDAMRDAKALPGEWPFAAPADLEMR